MSRTVIDLVDLDYTFALQAPLQVDEFCRQAQRRGVRVLKEQLEALYRAAVLTPLYRVERERRPLQKFLRTDEQRSEMAKFFRKPPDWVPLELPFFSGPLSEELRVAAQESRLHDPEVEPRKPWQKFRRQVAGYQLQMSRFLYSPYQLLQVGNLRGPLGRMRRSKSIRDDKLLRFTLKAANPDVAHWPFSASDSREVVVALSALEPRYRPEVTGRISMPITSAGGNPLEQWLTWRASFDPVELFRWLGWDIDRVRKTAEVLLTVGHNLDPVGEWYNLVRLIRPDKWDKLRGEALIALDYRIAAEMLLLFHEDLVKAGAAAPASEPPAGWWHPLHGRLRSEPTDLDAVLTDYGLSPHPSVVLVLEGETERELVPRVMGLLGIPQRPNFIRLENARGAAHDLSPLAAYAAAPAVAQADANMVLLARPVTRFLVVMDPEGKFANPQQRSQRKREWVDRIAQAVREQHGLEVERDDLERLVHIETWDNQRQAFEFAHFTDDELADAILRIYQGSGAPARTDLIAAIAGIRANQQRGHGNIAAVWKTWKGPSLTKTMLADTLWSLLEQKIEDARTRQQLDAVPIVRVLKQAYQLATELPRHSVVMRRST